MPMEILNGYSCKSYGNWKIEVKRENTYYWVEVGTILVEKVTNYICKRGRHVLIKVTEHKEEKEN